MTNKAAEYKMGSERRTMLKEANKYPGPGAHEAKSQLSGQKYGFGSSKRAELKKDGTPGPGSYEAQKVVGLTNSFS